MNAENKKPGGNRPQQDGQVFGTNSAIARKLQSYYGSLVTDDVPERFTQLLAKLETTESSDKKD